MTLTLRLSLPPMRWRFCVAVAVLLGCGFGAATALFNTTDTILFRPLRVPTADRLIRLELAPRAGARTPVQLLAPAADAVAGRHPAAVDRISGVSPASCILGSETAHPGSLVPCAYITAGFFDVVGLAPALRLGGGMSEGRVVVSDWFRRNHLSGRPAAVGSSMSVREFDPSTFGTVERRLVIAGIAPRGFHQPGDAQLWYLPPPSLRSAIQMELWAVLRPGAALGTSTEWLADDGAVTSSRLRDAQLVAVPLARALVSSSGRTLLIVLGAIGLLITAASLQIGGLLAARFRANARVQICVSLGAPTWWLVRQAVFEGVVVAIMAFGVGQAVSLWATTHLMNALPLQERYVVEHGSTGVMFGAAVTVAWLAVYCGVMAVVIRRQAQAQSVNIVARPSWATGWLCGVPYAVAVALAYVAGVLALGWVRTYQTDLGFASDNLIAIQTTLKLPTLRARDGREARERMLRELERYATSEPGVTSVARTSGAPFGSYQVRVEVTAQDASGPHVAVAKRRIAGAGFFATLGVPILRGRDFQNGDAGDTVAVVTAALAKKLWPDGDCLDRALTADGRVYRVIGMAADFVDQRSDALATSPQLYVFDPTGDTVLVRTNGTSNLTAESAALFASRYEQMANVQTFSYGAVRRQFSAPERAYAQFMWFVVLAGAGIAGLGLFAAVSEAQRDRMRDVGVQLALGSSVSRALAHVARRSFAGALCGAVAGVVLGLLVARVAAQTVRNVEVIEPLAILLTVLTTAASVLAALVAPARVASRADLRTLLQPRP